MERGRLKEGLYEQYGTVSKVVLTDPELSIGGKALYGLLCTIAGKDSECYPSINTLCHDLGIRKDTFHRYEAELIGKGYICVRKEEPARGRFPGNIYFLRR